MVCTGVVTRGEPARNDANTSACDSGSPGILSRTIPATGTGNMALRLAGGGLSPMEFALFFPNLGARIHAEKQ
jgi:hypothetical protein